MSSQLQRNVALNRAANVRAVSVAAGARRSTVRLYRGPASNRGETTTLASSGFQPDIEVECLPLSEILTPDEVRRARLVNPTSTVFLVVRRKGAGLTEAFVTTPRVPPPRS
jgi:hypothetical protein